MVRGEGENFQTSDVVQRYQNLEPETEEASKQCTGATVRPGQQKARLPGPRAEPSEDDDRVLVVFAAGDLHVDVEGVLVAAHHRVSPRGLRHYSHRQRQYDRGHAVTSRVAPRRSPGASSLASWRLHPVLERPCLQFLCAIWCADALVITQHRADTMREVSGTCSTCFRRGRNAAST
eukprot:1804365-Rhodomonas_salina.3